VQIRASTRWSQISRQRWKVLQNLRPSQKAKAAINRKGKLRLGETTILKERETMPDICEWCGYGLAGGQCDNGCPERPRLWRTCAFCPLETNPNPLQMTTDYKSAVEARDDLWNFRSAVTSTAWLFWIEPERMSADEAKKLVPMDVRDWRAGRN
jgi:hypothetical protein